MEEKKSDLKTKQIVFQRARQHATSRLVFREGTTNKKLKRNNWIFHTL
jgi:hypothetical protein